MPPITVFCPFTRPEMVNRWFDDLMTTDLVPSNTNLAFIIDCDEPRIYARIMENINKRGPFRNFIIIRNEQHIVNPMNIPVRRQRIAEIHEQSKDLIANMDGIFVLGLEDDTVFENLNVERLYNKAKLDQVGLISAYEAGRWYNKIIGIWNFDDVYNPKECWTILPSEGYEEIDAAGFYAYLTRTDYYIDHQYNTELWQPWGPDVNYGLDLRRSGLTNFVDWTQPCGHADQGIIITPDHNLYSEHFFLDEHPEFPNGLPQWIRRKQEL